MKDAAFLNRWRTRVGSQSSGLPKLVILAVGGRGLKSATWTMKVVQEADHLLDGHLPDHTVWITGASGGILGMGYLRELYLRGQRGETINMYREQ